MEVLSNNKERWGMSKPEITCQHEWQEETIREPTFNIAFGSKRKCLICGKEQFANFCEGRLGGPYRDVLNNIAATTKRGGG